MMTKLIQQTIAKALNGDCGSVTYDRSAKDWKITGIFQSDISTVMSELQKVGFARKDSAAGFYVEKKAD
jgi:hypothetical protein